MVWKTRTCSAFNPPTVPRDNRASVEVVFDPSRIVRHGTLLIPTRVAEELAI